MRTRRTSRRWRSRRTRTRTSRRDDEAESARVVDRRQRDRARSQREPILRIRKHRNERTRPQAPHRSDAAGGGPAGHAREQLLELFDERERPTPEQLQAALDLLAADYGSRGIELIEVASGWRIQVRPRCADVVSRLWQERPSRYSRALLETLALIAYRQPITRSEIEEIRGVSISSTIMRTLQERNWIRVVGHREVPGRPELLGTTREFLDYFGLKSLDQLPTLAELRDVETIGVQLELPGGEVPARRSWRRRPRTTLDVAS